MSLTMIRRLILLAALGAILQGCGAHATQAAAAAVAVRPQLAFNDYPLDAAFNEEMYFSKEAASGGRTLGGGGCGCN